MTTPASDVPDWRKYQVKLTMDSDLTHVSVARRTEPDKPLALRFTGMPIVGLYAPAHPCFWTAQAVIGDLDLPAPCVHFTSAEHARDFAADAPGQWLHHPQPLPTSRHCAYELHPMDDSTLRFPAMNNAFLDDLSQVFALAAYWIEIRDHA